MHTTQLALIILTLFTSSALSQTDRQLVDRYDSAIARENYKAALRTAQTIHDRYPESATWSYNLGAMHARLENTDDALAALQSAADLGYTGIQTFKISEDLTSLRDNQKFKSILNQVQANATKRLNQFKAHARKHKPQTHIPTTLDPNTSPPLILALHGTGMTGKDMINAFSEAANKLNMILIAPDALRPASNGFSWTYRDESQWFINHLIQNAIDEHNIDPTQIYLVGFSQGANIALSLINNESAHPFAGIIPISGHYEPQLTNTTKSSTHTPPTYLLTGARDPWKVTYAKAKRDLKANNTPVTLRSIPNLPHKLPQAQQATTELYRAITWCINNQPQTPDQPTHDRPTNAHPTSQDSTSATQDSNDAPRP